MLEGLSTTRIHRASVPSLQWDYWHSDKSGHMVELSNSQAITILFCYVPWAL